MKGFEAACPLNVCHSDVTLELASAAADLECEPAVPASTHLHAATTNILSRRTHSARCLHIVFPAG